MLLDHMQCGWEIIVQKWRARVGNCLQWPDVDQQAHNYCLWVFRTLSRLSTYGPSSQHLITYAAAQQHHTH